MALSEQLPDRTDARWFATTHWSAVLQAAGSKSARAHLAWEALARAYWSPLYQFVRRRGFSHHESEDLIQAFFARLIEKNVIREASQERGRFRSFILASLNNFLANEHDRANALKRGRNHVISFDACKEEECLAETEEVPAEKLFDCAWAESVLSHALRRLEQEFAADGKVAQFSELKPFLSRTPTAGEYDLIASRLGIRSALMATAVSRMRQRYRQFVRAEIAHTVARVSDIDDEFRYLVTLVAS